MAAVISSRRAGRCWHVALRKLFQAVAAPALLGASGCASVGIRPALHHYYAGRLPDASKDLAVIDTSDRNYILALMERGMIHKTGGHYQAAIRDWLDAQERIRELDYIRVSEKAASLVINDRTQTYTGKPFERALLHAFTAKSYFALAQWREAAVEARLIADGFENLNGFPDDPYTRYVAGLAFELIRDFNGARIEYTRAAELSPALNINPATGHIRPAPTSPDSTPADTRGELICFIAIGRTPSGTTPRRFNTAWGMHPYAEITHHGTLLGRSYTLNTTAHLAAETAKRMAAIQAAKTVSRIVIKDSIANAVADNNALLGEILRILLFTLEMPDNRSWETLPLWLQVARVPCPPDMESFNVTFKNAAGSTLRRKEVTVPITRTDGKVVSFVRIW